MCGRTFSSRFALLAFVVTLCFTATAGAAKRIAVLQPDGELLRAISIALSPWGVETLPSDAPLPGSWQPGAIQTATQLADEIGVDALVWVMRTERGSVLWVFDTSGDVTSRALVEVPPFDGAAAAAVALSVKTILRSSVVAPVEESRVAAEPVATAEPLAAAEVGAGVRWFEPALLDLRLDLAGLMWFPRNRRFGAAVELSWGPGIKLDDLAFRGTYRDVGAGASARVRVFDAPPVSMIASLGGALHWATLEGTAGTSAASVSRVNASIDAKAALFLHVTQRTYLGTTLDAAYLPAYQRYLVNGKPAFSPSPLTVTWSGHVGVELF